MNSNFQNISQLLQKALEGNLSPAEMEQLIELTKDDKNDFASDPAILNQIAQFQVKDSKELSFWENQLSGVAKQITTGASFVDRENTENYAIESIMPVHRVHFLKTAWFRYAAAIILMVGAALYGWLHYNSQPIVTDLTTQRAVDIKPGHNGAILTLSDGSQLVIDSLQDGFVTEQNGSKILLEDGRMTYSVTEHAHADMVYNTMTTPKGRQFQFTLPDGTKVWLNAASSIRYPTSFNEAKREVTIQGEAYFEVVQNAKAPFMVNVANKAKVEVLGTSFNISAYENDNSVQTTLVEGAVLVTSNNNLKAPVLLSPRDLAIINNGAQAIKVQSNVHLESILSWKNGMLNFEGVPFKDIMKQVERWYDIDVEYENGIPSIKFVGKVTRDLPLNGLLSALESTDVRFRVEGRKLIVMK